MNAFARPRRFARLFRWKVLAWGAGLLAAALLALAALAGFFDRDPIHLFGMTGKRAPLVAVYFSGDMGLRFGMGTHVAPALAARNIPVYGVSSSTMFAGHHTQAEVNALVASTIREALARAGADRVVVMGQSFGSDVLVAGLGALPQDLRAKVAATVLVVPARDIYFRADPSGFAYRGTPDADGVAHGSALTWTPLVCIYGLQETDSLCPALPHNGARVIGLPGGHFLHNDSTKLIGTIFSELDAILDLHQEQAK